MFRYRLALALGRTLGELSRGMSQAEFLGWQDYFEVEPWGSHYDDVRAGTVAACIVNGNRSDNSQAVEPLDFAPWNAQAQRRVEARKPLFLDDPKAQAQAIKDMFKNLKGSP